MNPWSRLRCKFLFYYLIPVLTGFWIAGFFIFSSAGYRWGTFLIIILVALLILNRGFSQFIIQPLKEIAEAVSKLTAGVFNYRVHLWHRRDELGVLGERLNDLAEAVQNKIENLSKALAESQAILGGMEEGVLILDRHGRVQKMNGAMENVFPHASSDIGKHYLEVMRSPEINDLIQFTLEKKQPQRKSLIFTGPPSKYFLIQSSIIRNASRKVEGIVLVFHEITDLKRLERNRQELVANVSHELRNPLTAINGYVEALLDGNIKDYSQTRQFLTIVKRHADRMDKIISDLLLLSEMESPDRGLKKEPMNILELIHAAADSLHPLSELKQQQVHMKIASEIPALIGDSQKIYQVIINLLQNAITHTPDHGEITIEVRTSEKGVEVTIGDTGIGIPDEDLPRIFERFYRVEKGRSREQGGAGLGLSIVKGIIEAHNGNMIVESKLGEGSRFTFILPVP